MNNSNNTYTFQISAGRGPAECCWVVMQFHLFLTKELASEQITITLEQLEKGKEKNTAASITLTLTGVEVLTHLKPWIGTIKWEGKSPFRPNHKRTNWYIATSLQATNNNQLLLADKDLVYQTFRASGAGGQHVNKTDTAVRVIHQPSGLSATASDSRSQHQNKKAALQRLKDLISNQTKTAEANQVKSAWKTHTAIERGNEIAVFKGVKFKRKG